MRISWNTQNGRLPSTVFFAIYEKDKRDADLGRGDADLTLSGTGSGPEPGKVGYHEHKSMMKRELYFSFDRDGREFCSAQEF